MSNEVAVRDAEIVGGALQKASSVDEVLDNLAKVEDLMKRAMHKGTDYGVIPGTERKDKDGKDISKPTLLKPGAEKLGKLFRLAPKFETAKTFSPDGHLMVESTCSLYDINDNYMGQAARICTTRESKYRYRGGARLCPECSKPNIRKSNKPPRNNPNAEPGFYCWQKTGGCGANFDADDTRITSQSEQKVENPDLADSYNTVIAIAEKRAYVAAMRIVTSSSSLFDEEIPGVTENEPESPAPPPRKPEPPKEDLEVVKTRAYWRQLMADNPLADDVNKKAHPEIKGIANRDQRAAAWNEVKDAMEKRGYVLKGTDWVHNAPEPVNDPLEGIEPAQLGEASEPADWEPMPF